MPLVLSIFVGNTERGSFSIVRDVTVIGRARPCNVRIAFSKVSRRHCQLIRNGDELTIEDLGSSNGTYHNGKKVDRAVLSPGDRIAIGPVTLVLAIDDLPGRGPASAEPAAAEPASAATDFAMDDELNGTGEKDNLIDLTAADPPHTPPDV
jgi:pSer/pThr/pTyr-binding forkhead associated (FHA) protein